MKKNKILKRILIIFGALVALAFVYVTIVYAGVFVPSFTRHYPDENQNKKFFQYDENFYKIYLEEENWFNQQNAQEITTTSFDGLKLSAYNLPNKNPVGTIILMHGYHSEPIREYSQLIHFYHDLGYNIILPFQRTHGKKDGIHSEGTYITFGVKERYDLRDWILKANQIYGETPLFLQGISMGCATTVMALGLELPSNVKGAIADCGFTSPREIIWKVLKKDMKLPTSKAIISIGNFLTNHLAGFDMDEYSTLDAIEFNKRRLNQIPILFIHGTKDDFVPLEMSEQNFAACLVSPYKDIDGTTKIQNNPQQDKYRLVEIPGSAHAIENFVAPEKYRAEIKRFLEENSPAQQAQ